MAEPTPIERAYQFIQSGRTDDARRALAGILQANPKDALAWALSARLAPDPERCAYALRQTVDRSDDNDLVQWAIKQLSRVTETGKMDSSDPPLLGVATGGDTLGQMFQQSAQSPRPASPPAPPSAPLKLAKPLPTNDAPESAPSSMGRTLREIGGGVMIIGVLVIMLAIVSEPLFQLIAHTGILPGWIGIVLIVVGGLLVAVGYVGDG
jgi:hypothetical protein